MISGVRQLELAKRKITEPGHHSSSLFYFYQSAGVIEQITVQLQSSASKHFYIISIREYSKTRYLYAGVPYLKKTLQNLGVSTALQKYATNMSHTGYNGMHAMQ